MRLSRRGLRRLADLAIARYLLPTACFGCGRALGIDQHLGACASCWASMRPDPAPGGLPGIHPIADLRAAVAYQGFARRALIRAKLHGRRELLEPLAGQLAAAVAGWDGVLREALILPVPSHPWTRLTRGFDPAAEFARAVARGAQAPFVRRVLGRRWASRTSFKRLGAASRRGAAERAFYCRRPALVGGRAVLLVDDVWTTGATARACARTLLAAGASSVHVAVWARTPRRHGGPPGGPSV